MNEKDNDIIKSSFSIDNILEDMKRIKNQVQTEDSAFVERPRRVWSMEEIDALLAPREKPVTGVVLSAEDFSASETSEKELSNQLEQISNTEQEAIESAIVKVVPEPKGDAIELEIQKNGEPDTQILLNDAFAENKTAPALPVGQPDKKTDFSLFERVQKGAAEAAEKAMPANTAVALDEKEPIENETVSQPVAEQKPAAAETEESQPPVHIPKIKRNIKQRRIDYTEKETSDESVIVPKIETDKYRDRFIKRPVQKLERTADYEALKLGKKPETIETPGFIKRKSQFTHTADLDPVPTIVAVEEELKAFASASDEKTIIAGAEKVNQISRPQEDEIEMDGQIKFHGFDEPKVEQIDEDEIERQVEETRSEKVKAFVINKGFVDEVAQEEQSVDENEDYPTIKVQPEKKSNLNIKTASIDKEQKKSQYSHQISAVDEYRTVKDKERVFNTILAAKKNVVFGIISLLILGAVLFFISIEPGVATLSGAEAFGLFSGSAVLYLSVNLILLIIALFIGLPVMKSGIQAILNKKPNADSSTAAAMFCAVLQNLVMFMNPQENAQSVSLLSSIAVLALVFNLFGRRSALTRILGNFEYCTENTGHHTIQKIENEDDAFEIGRGLLMGEPDIHYSSPISFPAHFLQNSFAYEPADELNARLLPVSLIASLVISIISGILSKNYMTAITTLTACVCIGIPASSLLASNSALRRANKVLNDSGIMISGYNAVEECNKTNAIVLDAFDVFKDGGCNIYGIKPFHSMRIDEAILYAAALVINSGGPLGEIFDRVILGRRELLPPVESLAYEDRLGLSAWIHGRRVLIGNRDLLINHNIEVPEEAYEKKYKHDGRQVIYLSVAGKLAAMFVVSYHSDDNISQYMKSLEENGITILIRTSDANITEELISDYFDLSVNSVKIISAYAGDLYKKYRDTKKDRADAGILHNGSTETLFRAVAATLSLKSLSHFHTILQVVGVALGLALIALLSFFTDLSQLGVAQVAVYQIFWAIVLLVTSKFKRY